VGQKLYAIAGNKQKKAILEMGGSNPAVVFDDVNIDRVVEQVYGGRFSNCGQVCDSIKRVIVHKSIAKKLVAKLTKRIEKVVIGDPEDEKTEIGSLVAKRQLETLKLQVEDARRNGAIVVIGGESPKHLKGAYYFPTLITNVKQSMRVWREEVFGPVLPVVSFSTEEEAVKLANDTIYGLGAKVFSKDKKRALRVASRIEAGCVDVNDGNHWQPCNPFGGYKASGVGREHGRWGFQELTQIKVIAEG
jgi:acyl-CoA reductase-like NAD-dependent aldehyde dehydrogenase